MKIAAISSKKLPDLNEGNIDNKNLYKDKELFEDADLEWYDYGFRNYDAQIGRFTQLDPLTDDYPHYTPYQYAGNEPIANVDLDGLEEWNIVTKKGLTGTLKLTGSSSFTFIKAAAPKVASKTFETTLKITTKVLQAGLRNVTDNMIAKNPIRNPKIPLYKEKSGGIPFNSKNGQGGETRSATDPDQGESIDMLMDMFGMAMKAKLHALKPDFSDPLTIPKTMHKILKEFGTSQPLPGSNKINEYEPNSKVDPLDHWESIEGWAGDTSNHYERMANRPIYLTDSNGKPKSIVIPLNKYKSDTFKFNH